MALSITTDLTVLNVADSETTDWPDIGSGGSAAAESDFWVQRTGSTTGCMSRAVSGAAVTKGMWFDNGTGIDFDTGGAAENMLIFIWLRCNTPKLIDTIAAGGLAIQLGTTTANYNTYYVGGSDFGISDADGWVMYVIDPSQTRSGFGGSGMSLNSIRYFGATITTTGTAKGQNIGIDQIAYGRGEIRVTGTNTTAGAGFAEIANWDWGTKTRRLGLIIERGGQFFCQCKFVIGDKSGSATTDFSSIGENLVWVTPMYHNGTNRVKAIPDADEDDLNYYGLDIVRASGTTACTFGVVVGSDAGRSGPSFFVASNTEISSGVDRQAWRLTRGATVDDFDIYGTTFRNCIRADESNAIDLTNCDANDQMFSNTFDSCGRIYFAAATVRNCFFLNSVAGTSDGAVLWNNLTNIQKSSFINPAFHSIVIGDSTGTPFSFNTLTFGTAALAVRYEDTENITISIVGGTTGLTAEIVSGTVTFSESVNMTLTVVDQGANSIQNARVGVFDAATGQQYMNELTDGSGNATEPYSSGGLPKSVIIRVRKNSPGDTRYLPFNSPAVISTSGLTATVALTVDTNVQ